MLILSRKKEQKILIGNDVTIAILEVRGDHVRVGIDAPAHIRVYRHEVYEAIQAENRAAALSQISAIQNLPTQSVPEE